MMDAWTPRDDGCVDTEICTIGDLILDVVVRPRAPLARDGDTPAAISLSAGGQAANVAAWAAALGARARLICARGEDAAARLAVADLSGRGVEICGPTLSGGGGVVVSTREVDGGRTMA
jgi:ribokinase